MYSRNLFSSRAFRNLLGRITLALVTIASLLSSVVAQGNPVVETRTEIGLRIETSLMTMVVTVSDKNGKPVLGLHRDNFRLEENGVPQLSHVDRNQILD